MAMGCQQLALSGAVMLALAGCSSGTPVARQACYADAVRAALASPNPEDRCVCGTPSGDQATSSFSCMSPAIVGSIQQASDWSKWR